MNKVKLTFCPKCNMSSMYCYCPKCGERKPQKQTNYERIKNMSIGEMAKFLSEIAGAWICKNKHLTICDECKEDVTKCSKDFATCMYEQYLLQEINC